MHHALPESDPKKKKGRKREVGGEKKQRDINLEPRSKQKSSPHNREQSRNDKNPPIKATKIFFLPLPDRTCTLDDKKSFTDRVPEIEVNFALKTGSVDRCILKQILCDHKIKAKNNKCVRDRPHYFYSSATATSGT